MDSVCVLPTAPRRSSSQKVLRAEILRDNGQLHIIDAHFARQVRFTTIKESLLDAPSHLNYNSEL